MDLDMCVTVIRLHESPEDVKEALASMLATVWDEAHCCDCNGCERSCTNPYAKPCLCKPGASPHMDCPVHNPWIPEPIAVSESIPCGHSLEGIWRWASVGPDGVFCEPCQRVYPVKAS